jgi:hypothetical protein
MNTFFDMPVDFQIGAIIAFVFLIFSLLLLLCKRGIMMQFTLLISFLSCSIYCHLPMVNWVGHRLGTMFVYFLAWMFLIKQFTKALAKEQLEKERKLYSSDFECVSADPLEFTWLDLNYYNTKQRELESLGFQKIGDFELLPQTRAFPETRTFSRKFINTEQDIEAAITHSRVVKPKNVFERSLDARIVEFSSEFSDGMFLETNNARGVSPIVEFGGIEMLMFEPTISLEKLLDVHEEKIEAICETKKVDVVVFRNASEQLAAAKREFLLICKDRQKKGGFTESENARIASYLKLNNDAGVKAYLSEYTRQARKRRKKQEDEFPQS